MNRWLDRSVYLVALAFVGGAAVAALVIFLLTRGDGDGDDQQVVATSTAPPTATGPAPDGAMPTTGTPPAVAATATTAAPTATPAGPTDPDEALNAFIRDELGSEHIGDCPQEMPPGGPPAGICSQELYRSRDLVTFGLGHPFSEGIGEAVIIRNEDGSWSVRFVQAPPLGEMVEVGSEAMVFGAGSCLNFREAPSISATVLSCKLDGTRGQVVEGPVDADGHTWWRLEGLGWASGQFLAPVPE